MADKQNRNCAHENDLLHSSKRNKNLKNEYFVFSNSLGNLIFAKLFYFFLLRHLILAKSKK